jgi:hypothetical protein
MRRSTQVAAPLLAAAAIAMLTGCRKPEMKRCVDETNHVVDESHCQNLPLQQNQQQSYRPGFPIYPIYRYYYGGWGGYGLGSIVGGGGYAPIAGRSYSTSTSRGGFGRSFSSEGGEGSGHGSAGE